MFSEYLKILYFSQFCLCCLNYYNFIMSFCLRPQISSIFVFFLKKYLSYCLLFFHINYRISLSSKFLQKPCWDFYWLYLTYRVGGESTTLLYSSSYSWSRYMLHLLFSIINNILYFSIKSCISLWDLYFVRASFFLVLFFFCYCKCDLFSHKFSNGV